jgi:thioredoxin
MLAVNDSNFQEVLGAPAAIVDFWHPLCGHCQDFKPIIEEIANEYNDRVLVVGAQVDQAKKWADKYDIDDLPAIIFFREGQEVHRNAGGLSKDELKTLIAQKLGV